MKEKSKAAKYDFLEDLKKSPIAFWIDSSGGPKEYCRNSFSGTNPKYYFYGSLDEVNLYECDTGAMTFAKTNCFDFIEEKIKEEKENKNGVFVGYFAYDLHFFFAFFENVQNVIASSDSNEAIPDRYEIASPSTRNDLPHLISNMTDAEYLEKIKQIKEEIKAGNVYQVNLTREYSLETNNIDELDLYLKLRSVSPNPYGCFFKTPFVSILSSSPEEFLFVKDGYIRTRPIKGTLQKNEFNIDPKNKAENIMIVDLERNDLGKICEYGSINAKKLLEIESYPHLNHAVSTIKGKLKQEINLKQIFEAMFPGGSITGAPKITAMKIIDKIEPTKRGAYTGSFGYIKINGEMKFNILIRTIFIEENKIVFNVGGGIVADSDPHVELEEIKLKAKGIIAALRLK